MIFSVKRIGSVQSEKLSVTSVNGEVATRFQDVLERAVQQKTTPAAIPRDPFQAMGQLSTRLLRKEAISPRELLLYQMRAGEFGVRVELASKVAESFNTALRKLQQQG